MTFKASLFSVLTMGNENQIPLVQFSLMYKLISMSVWNIQLRENRHVAWPSALESWSDALFTLGQIFWWLCMWYNKWQHPLFPLNPCSDTNSVAYCGIKGKFFSGPLFLLPPSSFVSLSQKCLGDIKSRWAQGWPQSLLIPPSMTSKYFWLWDLYLTFLWCLMLYNVLLWGRQDRGLLSWFCR